jgi:ferredoxin
MLAPLILHFRMDGMVKDYFFNNTGKLDLQLNDLFEVATPAKGVRYLVSNTKSVEAEIYAPEIDFYLEKSNDDIIAKSNNISNLYGARTTAYDVAQDTDMTVNVGRKVIIVSDEEQHALQADLEKHNVLSMVLRPADLLALDGHIGKLSVTISYGGKTDILETPQMIWFGAPPAAMKHSGIYDPLASSITTVIETVTANIGQYHFRNSIKYSSALCLLHRKRDDICGKCTDICPTNGIRKRPNAKELKISDIDCIGCGKCVRSCPSGAIDYAPVTRASFKSICSHYATSAALVIPGTIDLQTWRTPLPEGVLPLLLDSIDFLDETHLMTLLQTTGRPVVVYSERVNGDLSAIAALVNEIYRRKYDRQAIFLCTSEDDLHAAFQNLSSLPDSNYELDENDLNKRDIFSSRLAYLVGESDLGTIETHNDLPYGTVRINQESCTLCLSCADACSMGALTANPEDNSLRLKPSLCTHCGYCQLTCPEKNCLTVIPHQLSLTPASFLHTIVAQDELYSCVRCGIGFAPAKSIEKIISIMEPLFGAEATKIKTLRCCPDCKAKVMLEAQAL